ncbi:TonB-dependent siderophore receptor [Pseudoteredinibacter isoporae]|uniref:Iron complex outermembrane receptor protein n=1 Tax=Pseudoteredinibacter isoporae TaxID=570281 RepID=A0A7X0JSL3_9GAMM|nr:TonB-dependent siderophore receptor [Pseudoteredinibacter isoporae]MBB6520551.1 iron complex outermembrane receptor protein [Pseudoteredinibacter isoporae]NHO86118.1 TonB-dependent siderophore receptor [Pseudoteredinibacter isoporae]NIB25431.1 TonB-dependent siderophore receptor [Pseudoteredinibacter isoporae]
MKSQYRRGALCLSVLASAIAQTSLAEEATNDEIETVEVVGELRDFSALKHSTPILELARSVSIETADQFIEKGALNLSQTVSYLAGVTAETYGFATRGDWIRSRGLEIPRYRDSIQELFGSYNASRADVYTIEQVEVLKGPASVLYGQGSPGGLVNYVSKTPKDEQAGEVVAEIGNFDRRQIAVDVTGPLSEDGTWLYRLVGKYRDSDTQVDHVSDETKVFMPSITYQPSDDTSMTLIGLYNDTDSDSASQFIPVVGTLFPLADGSYLDQDVYVGEPGFNRFNTESKQVTFLATHRINDTFKVQATALWRDGEADYHQAWAAFTGDGNSRYLSGVPSATPTTVPRTFYQADNTSEQYAADIRLTANFVTGAIEHEVLSGVQYQDVTTDNNFSYFFGGGVLQGDLRYVLDLANPVYPGAPDQAVFDAIYTNNPEQGVEDVGVYISDLMTIGNWHLTAGLRYDEVENDNGSSVQKDDAVSLSAGILYAFDNGISPYISYAESFETVVGLTAQGTQQKPEEGEQTEIGIKYQPDGFPGIFTLNYFDIEISNLPNPNALPATNGQQLGVSKLDGFEFEGNVRLGEFYLQVAASKLDAKDPNGFELAATPESNASLWASWEPESLGGFRAGFGVRHVGKSVAETATLRYVTDSYTLADAMLGYRINDNWDTALNIRNISDKEYLTSCLTRGDCFPGVRRTITASINYSF